MTATRPSFSPGPQGRQRTEPFRSPDEAWFWTMAALVARRDGARIVSGAGLVGRPCEPDDVVKCLDRLYRQRRIDLQHVRIMRIWGERQQAPDPRYPREKGDWRLWREAMARLDWPLRVKGIVDGPSLPPVEGADILPFPGGAT
ncbi:hypothetical protein [Paracraurococcus ruber]|uniref:Uncharacterized protein n=1 Tax=Paracraurococcus ruber TaxID=77675 RepID=A0ABS1CTN3_9PROT|nr:hypothetical protein [Paracraurococcus ruber]MBK1657635.1 hypothetical protein [Paracraurococcus ruber]TDG34207.1 hypothetical protein E2C05_00175 [Paracraurococcus ruber]